MANGDSAHDQDSEDVRLRLEQLGYRATHVPRDRLEKRPDLLAVRGESRMFVEVKARELDASLWQRMNGVPVGSPQSLLTSLDKHNTLSAEVEDANEQLRALASPSDLRLLWYRAHEGLAVQGARDQLVATLLGLRKVHCVHGGVETGVLCSYAGFADFYRCREIDGAMIESGQMLLLVANPFSVRREAFRVSHVCGLFGDAVVDGDAGVYVVDGDVDRRDDEAVLAFIRKKYPEDRFIGFLPHQAGMTVHVIDARTELKRRDGTGGGEVSGADG